MSMLNVVLVAAFFLSLGYMAGAFVTKQKMTAPRPTKTGGQLPSDETSGPRAEE
jgi:hypothetical protein